MACALLAPTNAIHPLGIHPYTLSPPPLPPSCPLIPSLPLSFPHHCAPSMMLLQKAAAWGDRKAVGMEAQKSSGDSSRTSGVGSTGSWAEGRVRG